MPIAYCVNRFVAPSMHEDDATELLADMHATGSAAIRALDREALRALSWSMSHLAMRAHELSVIASRELAKPDAANAKADSTSAQSETP